MSRIKGIEQLKGKGIKARIIDAGKVYTTYRDFARAVGYPSATIFEWHPDKMRFTYDVLAKGKHEYYDIMLYVVENERGERFIIGEKGLTFIYENNKEESAINLRDMSYGDLKEHVTAAVRELCTKAYGEGYGQGRFDQRMDDAFGREEKVVRESTDECADFPYRDNVNPPSIDDLMKIGKDAAKTTAQERRDEIVEQAKADIERLKDGYYGFYTVSNGTTIPYACSAEFIVNKEKRTVVVLLRGKDTGKIYARGIAKCAPNDCFNVHIGKAIALRRALGLEVPDEYLNAPQPTEVRVGDIVKAYKTPCIKPYKVSRIEWNRIIDKDGTWLFDDEVEIIDDSREGDDD